MKKRVVSLILLLTVSISTVALAHSGRTDSKGGHWNRKTGTYHYHNSGSSNNNSTYSTQKPTPLATQKLATPPPRPTASPLPNIKNIVRYGLTNVPYVDMWNLFSIDATRISDIPKIGTLVEILDVVQSDSGGIFFRILHENIEAYVLSDFVDVLY